MVKKAYKTAKKIFTRDVQLIDQLIGSFLSFNLTYICKELNVVTYKLIVFVSSPSMLICHDMPHFDVISLYHCYVLANDEFCQILENDEDIFYFIAKLVEEMPAPSV